VTPPVYSWLTVNDDGSLSAEMVDTTPAEMDRRLIIMQELQAGRLRLRQPAPDEDPQWCPVCKAYHASPGEKTDAGQLTRPCPLLPDDDPRNRR
jgi:hypothetical protein